MNDEVAWSELPRVAGRVGATVELTDVRLVTSSFEVLTADELPEETTTSVVNIEQASRSIGDELVYFCTADVLGIADAREWGFRFDAVYAVTYSAENVAEFSEGETDAFATVTVIPTIVPYVREFVQSLTHRAGLPHFTLPLWRVPILST